MLYSILKVLMQITERVFFRSITIRNKELIPEQAPLMIVANHPSTFMDPIVIATMLNREVYFLAKGELFKGSFLKWLLSKFNMIPVYRKQDDPSQMNKNQDTFIQCFEHLENGGTILIFPEGTSITERKLRPIKTGAARIALGAEARNNFQLGIHIITIGLNYTDPHKFNRDLFVNIHTPIAAKDYQDKYMQDEIKGAQDLTEAIRNQLAESIIAIEDRHTDAFVKDVEMLYKYKRAKELGIHKEDKEADFNLSKKIIEAVTFFIDHDKERAEKMRLRLKSYIRHLKLIGITDVDLEKNKKNKSFLRSNIAALFNAIIGLPFYLYGLINNYLAFEIPAFIARKATHEIEYRGAIGMVLGLCTFSIFYTIQTILVWKYSDSIVMTFFYFINLPVSGFFAYWYYYKLKEIRTKWLLMMIFYKKSTIIAKLIIEREQIISELFKAKDEYYQITK